MQTDIEAALIGINHLAERLGLSRRTVHRILARGELALDSASADAASFGSRSYADWLAGHEVPTPGANVTNPHRQFSRSDGVAVAPDGDNFAHRGRFLSRPRRTRLCEESACAQTAGVAPY